MKENIFKMFVGKCKNIIHFVEAILAVAYFRFPSRRLYVIGVTGTDGKTTTTSLLYHILMEDKKRVAMISTLGGYIGRDKFDTGLHVTTPSSWFTQKFLRKLVDKKYEYVILETTSHGLDQHRLLGVNFKIGVLTNLTREHLDYHKTMLNYAKSKAKLFRDVSIAIVNFSAVDEVNFEKLISRNSLKIIDYNSSFIKHYTKHLSTAINSRFPQKYNVLNAIAAVEVSRELGVFESVIEKAIRSFPGISGRLEEVKNKHGVYSFIDFAHTPNSLEVLLSYLKHSFNSKGKLVVVFGCAGDRDKGKRPMMGKIASKYADVIVLTAEDPRNENINEINKEIMSGISSNNKFKGKVYENEDRQKAIQLSVNISKRGDILVICGKGHEKSLNIKGVEHYWDEKEALKTAFERKID